MSIRSMSLQMIEDRELKRIEESDRKLAEKLAPVILGRVSVDAFMEMTESARLWKLTSNLCLAQSDKEMN